MFKFQYGRLDSGKGTEADPYIIRTASELQAMKDNLSAYYELHNDIDLSEIANFIPIGTGSNNFQGNLNGNGYTISNLKITSSAEYIGLFGYVNINNDNGIYDLNIVNANIISTQSNANSFIGILCGYSCCDMMRNCHVQGKIKATQILSNMILVGGLIGESYANHTHDCSSNIDIEVIDISESPLGQIGGFCGGFDDIADVQRCYSKGKIIASAHRIGGFMGRSNCNSPQSYIDCYSSADVTNTNTANYAMAAGFCGCFENVNTTIDNCFAYGEVSGTIKGGFTSDNEINIPITNCYWDIDATGCTVSADGIGKTTQQMKHKTTFNDWNKSVWKISEGKYPVLRAA